MGFTGPDFFSSVLVNITWLFYPSTKLILSCLLSVLWHRKWQSLQTWSKNQIRRMSFSLNLSYLASILLVKFHAVISLAGSPLITQARLTGSYSLIKQYGCEKMSCPIPFIFLSLTIFQHPVQFSNWPSLKAGGNLVLSTLQRTKHTAGARHGAARGFSAPLPTSEFYRLRVF